MRIQGARVADDDARRLVASLVGTGWPDARAAARRIVRGLESGTRNVRLAPREREAVLRTLVDPPDALVELRGALARDFRHRTRAVTLPAPRLGLYAVLRALLAR